MHNLVKEIVYLLAKKDDSWRHSSIARDRTVSMGRSYHVGEEKEQEKVAKPIIYTPLLMAACSGITEIVEVIIHLYPQSIEHVSEDEQNILYMAVKHRQLEIFRMLKKLKMVRRLAGKIDKESNTVLHYTAEFQGGSQPGYALQLQEELHWFEVSILLIRIWILCCAHYGPVPTWTVISRSDGPCWCNTIMRSTENPRTSNSHSHFNPSNQCLVPFI